MEQKKAPLDLGLKMLENYKIVRHNEFRFISSEFGFVNSFIKMEPSLFAFGQPYRIKEGRIALVKQGVARVSINLIEHNLQAGNLSLMTPTSIIQVIEVSPDFDMQMIAIDNNFLPISEKEDFFTYLLHHQRNILLSLTPQEHIRHLIASLLYNIEYIAKHYNQMKGERLTHQESIFQQFISLVNSYSKTERNVGFYADKLCLTPRYLNTLIRQTSQQTVMDWINQSIILEAKVLLKHSNLLVYQISDELNFPNPSFFCKFFKRMTGMTPQEYQKSE